MVLLMHVMVVIPVLIILVLLLLLLLRYPHSAATPPTALWRGRGRVGGSVDLE